MTVHYPLPARPFAPQGNQCSISHFLASLGAHENWYCTHIPHRCCDRLTAVRTGYPLTSITWPYRELRWQPMEVEYFLKFSADKLLARVKFVLQNSEILHSVRGLYDKNSASKYCFTSDVMYKWYKRLVYTHPDLLARFCKVNLSNAKNSAWFFFQEFVF